MTTKTISEVREGARRVSDGVRLDQIYLVSLTFQSEARFSDEQFLVDTSLRVRADYGPNSTIIVSARHESTARKESDSESKTSWRATVEHEARFDIVGPLEDISDDDFMAFAIDVSTDILHPYSREAIQSMTGRSSFPAFTLGRSKSIWEKPAEDLVEIGPIELEEDSKKILDSRIL